MSCEIPQVDSPVRAVDVFEAVCHALEGPAGAERLDTFLQLPREQRVEILRELTAEEVALGAEDANR